MVYRGSRSSTRGWWRFCSRLSNPYCTRVGNSSDKTKLVLLLPQNLVGFSNNWNHHGKKKQWRQMSGAENLATWLTVSLYYYPYDYMYCEIALGSVVLDVFLLWPILTCVSKLKVWYNNNLTIVSQKKVSANHQTNRKIDTKRMPLIIHEIDH